METVKFSLSLLDDSGDLIQPYIVGGAVAPVCLIPPGNSNKADTQLDVAIVAGVPNGTWKDGCVKFKTRQSPQELKIKLATTHRHVSNGKPLFHFIRVESERYDLIKEIRCYTDPNPNIYQVVQYAHHFPEHTHTVDIVFTMSGDPLQPTKDFKVNLFVTRLDTHEIKNCDPQVGNEPPGNAGGGG